MSILFSRCRRLAQVAYVLAPLMAMGAASAQDNQAPAAGSQRRESIKIEPYTGPPIYLPAGEAPPPPTEVESRVVKEKFPDSDTVRFERGVIRFSDDSIVSNGPHKEYYSNGELYVEGEFDHAVATGEWTYHHRNGQVAKVVTYKRGRPDGEVKVYNEDGKLIAKRQYAEGRREGVWETYSDDGEQKLREENYKDGVANGTFRTWFSNGQLRQETTFVDGKLEGLATEWTQVGDKRAEVNFKNGLKEGVSKLWQSDGKVIEQTFEAGKLVSRKG